MHLENWSQTIMAANRPCKFEAQELEWFSATPSPFVGCTLDYGFSWSGVANKFLFSKYFSISFMVVRNLVLIS